MRPKPAISGVLKSLTLPALALAGLAIGILLYVVLLFEIAHAVEVITEAKADAELAGLREEAGRAAALFMTETAEARAEIAGFVVDDENPVALIEAIEDAARRSGISVTIGSVSVIPGSWEYHEAVSVGMSARGAFSDLGAFVTRLESLPLASRVEDVSLESLGGGAWFGTFTVRFVKEKPRALPAPAAGGTSETL